MVAAVASFSLGGGLWALSIRPEDSSNGFWAGCLDYVSVTRHMSDFARGVIEGQAVLFYATMTCLFLFLTHRVVESRRWN
jgi:ABC-2 type transport system permease protein